MGYPAPVERGRIEPMGLESMRPHEGYRGVFIREEAEGAYPNGTRIRKATWEMGDTFNVGAEGTVLGSALVPEHLLPWSYRDAEYVYFVEWDDLPLHAVGVQSSKIERVDG